MEVSGVLTVIKPLGAPVGTNNNRYAWGKIRIDDGREIDLMFVNRTFIELANQPVVIKDVSETQDKLQWLDDKQRYKVMGTGISVMCGGTEYCSEPAAAAAPVASAGGGPPGASGVAAAPPGAAGAPTPAGGPPGATGGTTPTPRRAGTMEDLVDFGLHAVGYARSLGETCPTLLASIFGASMHGYKEGRNIDGEDTWAARKVLKASSCPPEDYPEDPQEALPMDPPGASAVIPMSQQPSSPF